MSIMTRPSCFKLGDRKVNRMGYGAMQLAGPGAFGPPPDRPASNRDYGSEIVDRLAQQGVAVRITRFFGGAGLTKDGLQFGFVIKGTLYFRVDSDSRQAYAARGASPFEYAARDKKVTVASYYEVPVDIIESDEALAQWATRANSAATKGRAGRSQRE